VKIRPRRTRAFACQVVITAVALVGPLLAVAGSASAAPASQATQSAAKGKPAPAVDGLKPTKAPKFTPKALPRKSGAIAVNRNTKIVPASVSAPSSAKPAAASAAASAAAPKAAAAAVPTNQVGVRALVIGVDSNDFGTPTWTSMLDHVGAAYDVLNARTTPLTSTSLVNADGTGKYNAILLDSNSLLYQDSTGAYVSALTADQWNILWAYERTYAVRQATLYNSYGTFPEDYCLRAGTEGGTGANTQLATLTAAATGTGPFSDLKAGAQIPITQSYVYNDTIAAGCSATSMLNSGSNTLGVLSTSTDGRQRLTLTFTNNQYLLQSNLLTYAMFRWASRGLFLGELRHSLNMDVDDWFNESDEMQSNGVLTTWNMTAHDAYNASLQQAALRTKYPLASQYTLSMAFNGSDANLTAGSTCSPNGTVAQLTATSKCLKNTFRWINHTYDHPDMDFTTYAQSVSEITQNRQVATTLGLPAPTNVVKSGGYSGLGVYNPDPNDDVDPPTDFGLTASNPAFIQAAHDNGVTYLHGNMSFASHAAAVANCFNCGFNLGLNSNNTAVTYPTTTPAVTVVPDFPTNIWYFSTTPDEETYYYNQYYGPGGKFPFYTTNQTYSQILANESSQEMGRIAEGYIYTNTFHIGNLRDYGSGATLLNDWANATVGLYSSYYAVPLQNQGWPGLATYATDRMAHFAELTAGVKAVYDRGANTVTVTSPAAGSVTVSGAKTTGFTTYGKEVSAKIALTANTPVTFTPSLLP
jgi:hypothetical protein